MAAGAVVGWAVPGAGAWAVLVEPVLAPLLLATFLVVPAVVFGLSRFVAHDDVLLVGVLLVLLAPCVDYVIAFTALAGGAAERLLAAAPLLMLVQLVVLPVLPVLPVLLRVVAGEAAVAAVDVGPFVRALVMLILVPLALAALLQWGAVRGRGGVRDTAAGVVRGFTVAMVPLMVVTLFTVVASQIRGVGERLPALAAVVPLFVAFAVVMVALGVVAARWARLDVPAGRALVSSGATRNSLVVLPLALALPASLDPAPLVVVTQTLVELGAMVSLVRLVPRLLPLHGQSAGAGAGRTVT
ncbi:arsenic resistance protein [Micrococcus luteus]|nr:arsenic resistance protein [Micrococcus luteus]PAL16906.1 arsenic resistance protein [Micrococcus luteus]